MWIAHTHTITGSCVQWCGCGAAQLLQVRAMAKS